MTAKSDGKEDVRECKKCKTFKTLDKFINGNPICTACAGYVKYVLDQSRPEERK